ncbi:MAG TPA: hypothetical protein VG840_04525, partial [Casimicrobiaceae bacterium]|nr:hypothetical protein [Casimicrobiaceae bacterium]
MLAEGRSLVLAVVRSLALVEGRSLVPDAGRSPALAPLSVMITGFSLPLAALSGVAFDACASAACGAGAEGNEERVGAAESDEAVPCVAAFGASGTRVSYRDVRAAA